MSDESDLGGFFRYARERLNAPVYDSSSGREDRQMFAASLSSIRPYLSRSTRARNSQGEAFVIDAGYIDGMTPNACAERFEGTYVIASYQALLVTMVEYCLFAFTQRDLFPEVGGASVEDSPVLEGGVLPGLMLMERTLAGEPIDPVQDSIRVPKDADRHVMAVYAALLMSRFAWLHELAHCFMGHVDLVQSLGIAPRLYELEVAEFSAAAATPFGPRWLVLRALEFEADETAFFLSCDVQLAGTENIEGIKALPLDLRLRLNLFAAFAFASLIEALQIRLGTKRGLTHPRPPERLRNLFNAAARPDQPEAIRTATDAATRDLMALGRAMPALDLMSAIGAGRSPIDIAASDRIRAEVHAACAPYRFSPASAET